MASRIEFISKKFCYDISSFIIKLRIYYRARARLARDLECKYTRITGDALTNPSTLN